MFVVVIKDQVFKENNLFTITIQRGNFDFEIGLVSPPFSHFPVKPHYFLESVFFTTTQRRVSWTASRVTIVAIQKQEEDFVRRLLSYPGLGSSIMPLGCVMFSLSKMMRSVPFSLATSTVLSRESSQ